MYIYIYIHGILIWGFSKWGIPIYVLLPLITHWKHLQPLTIDLRSLRSGRERFRTPPQAPPGGWLSFYPSEQYDFPTLGVETTSQTYGNVFGKLKNMIESVGITILFPVCMENKIMFQTTKAAFIGRSCSLNGCSVLYPMDKSRTTACRSKLQAIVFNYMIPVSGWWFQPLWKIWKSNGMIIQNIWKKEKSCSSHHQPALDEGVLIEDEKRCIWNSALGWSP